MKEKLSSKKVFFVLLFLIIIFLGFNYFSKKQEIIKEQEEKQDRLEKIVLEHNSSISEKKSFKKENFENIISKEEKQEIIHNKDFGKSEAELDGDVKAEPYTGLLPEAPDMQENDATLLGIDSNNNGVRDDIEIEIVDLFGEDKNLVEAFFASNRSSQYAYSLAQNDLLTDENIQKIMDNSYVHYKCSAFYFKKSKYLNNYEDFNEAYMEGIRMDVLNTKNRKSISKKVANSFSGQSKNFDPNEKSCQDFFERTKSFKIIR